MQRRLKLVTSPVEEIVTLDEAKSQVRVDHTDEDLAIVGMVEAVRLECEQTARRAFVTQTWDMTLDKWPTEDEIALPLPPLQSVTSITYVNEQNVTHTMPGSDYFVDADGEPGRVCLGSGKCWPAGTLRPKAAIKVRFVAGYGDAVAVPAIYRQAVLMGLSAYYENRGDGGVKLPDAAISLLMLDRGEW